MSDTEEVQKQITEDVTNEELTEVTPEPDEESVTMKVNETTEEQGEDEDKSEVDKLDPHSALMQMPVTNQNEALNCLIGFVGIAQRRGVFALDEAAKAYHCVQMFRPPDKTN